MARDSCLASARRLFYKWKQISYEEKRAGSGGAHLQSPASKPSVCSARHSSYRLEPMSYDLGGVHLKVDPHFFARRK